MVINL
ncbi:78091c0b-41d1-4fa9-b944-eff9d58a6688 [Thermothielavioides terrestris]